MMRAVLVVVGLLGGAATAHADARKVLVLPLDGTADAPTRAKVTASVQRLARVLDASVQVGGQGFQDTAAVVGCDPTTPTCADEVRAALAVDELVYGDVNSEPDGLVVIVRRANGTGTPRELTAALAPTDGPDKVEPAILPLFGDGPLDEPPPVDPVPVEPVPVEPVPEQPVDHRRRNIGIACVAGGSAMFLIGLLSWSSASKLQGQIDDVMPSSYEEFVALEDVESRASTRAWTGNLFVLGGLALGGYGGWILYQDHKGRQVSVAPTPTDGGAAMTMRGAW